MDASYEQASSNASDATKSNTNRTSAVASSGYDLSTL